MNSAITSSPLYIELSKKLHPQDFEVLKQLLNQHEFDLAPTHGFFEERDFNQITQKALEEYFKKIRASNLETIDGEDLRYLWREVVSDFQKKYWGFEKKPERPSVYRSPRSPDLPLLPHSEIPKRPSKKISYKDSFFYIWSVLQAMIITKALILVFGNELAKDDTIQNRIIFAAVMIFSFGSLFVFVWIRRKTPK